MKALAYIIYGIELVVVTGAMMYSAYMKRQIDKGIEKLSKKDDEEQK